MVLPRFSVHHEGAFGSDGVRVRCLLAVVAVGPSWRQLARNLYCYAS
jgi:hypothetical protein